MLTFLGTANNKAICRRVICLELLNNFDSEDTEPSHSESSENDIEEKYSSFKKRSIAVGKQDMIAKHFPKIHRSALRKIIIDLLYF